MIWSMPEACQDGGDTYPTHEKVVAFNRNMFPKNLKSKV